MELRLPLGPGRTWCLLTPAAPVTTLARHRALLWLALWAYAQGLRSSATTRAYTVSRRRQRLPLWPRPVRLRALGRQAHLHAHRRSLSLRLLLLAPGPDQRIAVGRVQQPQHVLA